MTSAARKIPAARTARPAVGAANTAPAAATTPTSPARTTMTRPAPAAAAAKAAAAARTAAVTAAAATPDIRLPYRRRGATGKLRRAPFRLRRACRYIAVHAGTGQSGGAPLRRDWPLTLVLGLYRDLPILEQVPATRKDMDQVKRILPHDQHVGVLLFPQLALRRQFENRRRVAREERQDPVERQFVVADA